MSSNVESREAEQALSIGEVVEQYGVTLDQLRHWDRIGVLVPRRIGARRVYFREHLEKLAYVLRLMRERGWSLWKVRVYLEIRDLNEPRSISALTALEQRLRRATKGDVIREPLPSKRFYNSVYVRLIRKVRKLFPGKSVGIGKDVEIRLSDDERFLEARFNR